ncbi:MAG: hypothetical protein LBR95_02225 [Azoarcus sp.]|jgi:hypothetical protein|nr:hypothetical protein [Azoarcus sp.]
MNKLIGMVWYERQDYDAILRIMTDRDKLPATFHEWRMSAESGEKQLRRSGHTVVRARIDPETFPDWCRARGLNVDAQARIEFSRNAALERYRHTHPEIH